MRKSLEKVFDIIGEILAVLALILYVFLAINAQFMFLPDGVLNVLMVIQQYSFIIVTLVVGFEAMISAICCSELYSTSSLRQWLYFSSSPAHGITSWVMWARWRCKKHIENVRFKADVLFC